MRAQYISISEAARLVGKARETVQKAAQGLDFKPGPKNSKTYNANALFMSIYCGNERALYWQADEHFWHGDIPAIAAIEPKTKTQTRPASPGQELESRI